MGVLLDRLATVEGDMLDTGQLAKVFGVSRTTIHTWARKGIIPCPVIINKRKYFYRDDLNDYIQQLELDRLQIGGDKDAQL